MNFMKLVFLGPPGSGKGTIAKIISRKLKCYHISTGDLFREQISHSTPLGKKIEKIVENGELVPDSITIEVIKNQIKALDMDKNIILDGFPRSIFQAKALDKLLQNIKIINFMIDEKLLIKRLSGRRICKTCNNIFNIYTFPSKKIGICDICKGLLYQREDDKDDHFKVRLKEYNIQTKPLIEFYSKFHRLENIDVSTDIDTIEKKIINMLNNNHFDILNMV